MKLHPILWACLALALALPLNAQSADQRTSPTPVFSALTLANGQVLKQASVVLETHDYVVMQSSSGVFNVPYDQLPPDLRKKLEGIRPKEDSHWVAKGDGVVKVAPETTAKAVDLKAKQKMKLPGQISMPGPTDAGIPITEVIVYAVRPSDFAAYNAARLKVHGDAINASLEVLSKLMKAAPPGTPPSPELKAAISDARLTIYASFEKPPPYVAMTFTDDKGHFLLMCDDPQVVLVARASMPADKDNFDYLTWVAMGIVGTDNLITSKQLWTQ